MPHVAWGAEVVAVSGAYLVAYVLSYVLVFPVQLQFLPVFPATAILIYLPCGIQVLAAWLLGWRAVLVILPGSFAAYLMFQGWPEMRLQSLVSLYGIVAAAATFGLARAVGVLSRWVADDSWRRVMLVGVAASVCRVSGVAMTLDLNVTEFFAHLLGDALGIIVTMVVLMFIFREMRKRGI